MIFPGIVFATSLTAMTAVTGLYRNDAYGVTLQFPKGVTPEESTEEGTLLMAATPSRGIVMSVFFEDEEDKPSALEREPYFDNWLAGFERQSAWRPILLHGADTARVLDVSKDVGGHVVTGQVRAARRGHLIYAWLACGEPGSGFERGATDAKRYLDSLQLVSPRGPAAYRDEKNGFALAMSPRWHAAPTIAGQSELLRLVTPLRRMAATVNLVPARLPDKLDPHALTWLERVFKQGRPTYHRISARQITIRGATAFDYWFTTQIDGRQRAQGARILWNGERALLLLVTARGSTPDTASVALLETFGPVR